MQLHCSVNTQLGHNYDMINVKGHVRLRHAAVNRALVVDNRRSQSTT
jgi:hypothetical protein